MLALGPAVMVRACMRAQGRTPPMGWRNWNFFQGAITQQIMQDQMAALTQRSRKV